MTILDALADPNLFGALAAFRELGPWRVWSAFIAAVYGLPMTDAQLVAFRTHTGRQAPNPAGTPRPSRSSGRSRQAENSRRPASGPS
jgi:hypothetical protein